MLAKLNVRMVKKDKDDPTNIDKQVSAFVNLLINDDVIASVIPIPDTNNSHIILINNTSFIYRGSIDDVLKVYGKK
tara:strand:- start:173 stop:400 length:228 start_codon:yes stop_codon:yes gene_type:complete